MNENEAGSGDGNMSTGASVRSLSTRLVMEPVVGGDVFFGDMLTTGANDVIEQPALNRSGQSGGEAAQEKSPQQPNTIGGAKPPKTWKCAAKNKFRICYLCEQDTDDWGTKAECRPCNNDKESAERDAKRQNEGEYFKEVCNDVQLLREFLAEWRKECGPARGRGNRRGGFKFGRFKNATAARSAL